MVFFFATVEISIPDRRFRFLFLFHFVGFFFWQQLARTPQKVWSTTAVCVYIYTYINASTFKDHCIISLNCTVIIQRQSSKFLMTHLNFLSLLATIVLWTWRHMFLWRSLHLSLFKHLGNAFIYLFLFCKSVSRFHIYKEKCFFWPALALLPVYCARCVSAVVQIKLSIPVGLLLKYLPVHLWWEKTDFMVEVLFGFAAAELGYQDQGGRLFAIFHLLILDQQSLNWWKETWRDKWIKTMWKCKEKWSN